MIVRIHKKLIGEGAEIYLPFALSKIRYFNSEWTAPVVKIIQNDSVYISISIPDKDLCHLTIISEGAGYDFCTLEEPSYTPPPGEPLPVNHASMVRSFTYRGARGITSTVFPGVPTWTLSQYPYAIPTYAGVNRQRFSQRSWTAYDTLATRATRPNAKQYFVESTNAIDSYANRFDRRWTTFGWPRVILFGPAAANTYTYWTPDHLFDVPTAFYSPGRSVAAVPAPSAPLWFRRAAVRDVGGRKFFIHTDAHSNFYAYPVGGVGTQNTFGYSVAPANYFMSTAASYLPAGTVVPSMTTLGPGAAGGATITAISVVVDEGSVDIAAPYVPEDYTTLYPDYEAGWNGADTYQHNHYLWAFNADCTKAAAVVYVDEFERYQTETSLVPADPGGTPRPYRRLKTGTSFVSVNHYTEADATAAAKLADAGGLATATVSRRAVVEVDLNLAVTGAGAMDFTFSVTHARTIADKFFVDADYLYNDSRLPGTPGELVTASFEQYARNDNVGGDPLAEGTPEVWNPATTTLYVGTVRTVGFLCIRKADGTLLRSFKMTEVRLKFAKFLLSSPYLGNISASPAASPYGRDIGYTNIDYTLRTTVVSATLIRQFVRLHSMDLRSMSFALEVYRNLNAAPGVASALAVGTSLGTVSYAFNAITDNPYPTLGAYVLATFPPPADGGVAWTAVSYAYKTPPGAYALETHTEYLDHYRHQWELIADANTLYTGISSHPDGHVAFADTTEDFAGGVQGVDWIRHARRTPGGVSVRAKTHLSEFNAAYNQTRMSADYALGGAYYDGAVKSYGTWRTFTPAPFPFKLSV